MEELQQLLSSYTGGFTPAAQAATAHAFAHLDADHGLWGHLDTATILRHYGRALQQFTWGCYVLLYRDLPAAQRAAGRLPAADPAASVPAWASEAIRADVIVGLLELQSGWLTRELTAVLDQLCALPGVFLGPPTVAPRQMMFQWICERFVAALEALQREVPQPSETDVASTEAFQRRAEELVYLKKIRLVTAGGLTQTVSGAGQ